MRQVPISKRQAEEALFLAWKLSEVDPITPECLGVMVTPAHCVFCSFSSGSHARDCIWARAVKLTEDLDLGFDGPVSVQRLC